MPGKPYETSFPAECFTVKDQLGLENQHGTLDPGPGFYRHFYRRSVSLAGDSHR